MRQKIYLYISLLLMTVLGACQEETFTSTAPDLKADEYRFTMALPEPMEVTRAMGDQAAFTRMNVFVFNDQGVFVARREARDVSVNTNNPQEVTFTVELAQSETPRILHFVGGDVTFGTYSVGDTEASIFSELTVSGNILVDGGAWGDMGAFTDKLKACGRAVNERESVLIDYISREGEHSRRTIDPYLLILKRNVWYVYAFCHTKQSFRTFKIGRIKKLTFTGRRFERTEISKRDIPLDFFYTPDQMTDVTLEIERGALADAEEWLGVDAIEPRGNALVCEIKLPAEGLANTILSFGGAVKVLAPQALADEVKAVARAICGD